MFLLGTEFEQLSVNGSLELHKIVKVPEDASSLFNSLSYLVYGDTSQGSLIRFFIVEHIGNNWINFQKYAMTKYTTKEEYMTEMLKSTTNGGGCELIAAGSIFPFCFEVYVDGTRYSIFGDSKKPIRRLRSSEEHGNHYDAYEPNEKDSLTVNKNNDKAMKRKMSVEKESPNKNECKKVWKKKLKIEENPFATVWLNDNDGSPEAKINSKDNVAFQKEVEECSVKVNKVEEMDLVGESSGKDGTLVVVDAKTKNLTFKAKRGRPKKPKLAPELYDWESNGNEEENELPQEGIVNEEESEISNNDEKVKIPWMISLKRKSVGRPRVLKNSINFKNSILEKVQKKRGRPRIHPQVEDKIKKPRGRPRIYPKLEEKIKKPRGRPRKEKEFEENLVSSSGFTGKLKVKSDINLGMKTELILTQKKRGRPRKVVEFEEVPGMSGSDSDGTEKVMKKSLSLIRQLALVPRSKQKKAVKKIKKKRKRSKKGNKAGDVPGAIKPASDWDLFVVPLLDQKIIPLPFPGFTKPSDIPARPQGRPKKLILNKDDEEPTEPKVARPRGRPRKEKNLNVSVDTTAKSTDNDFNEGEENSDWSTFVEPLLEKSIIPLALPGFTNPTDIPARPRKSILNQLQDEEPENKIKRKRGRPRKVLPAFEDSQSTSELNSDANTTGENPSQEEGNLDGRNRVEVVKRPRGRPPKKSVYINLLPKPVTETIDSVKENPKNLENDFCDQENSKVAIESNPSIPRIKIKLLNNSIVTLNEDASSQPGNSEIRKKTRGRPKKIISSTFICESEEKNSSKEFEENGSVSLIQSQE